MSSELDNFPADGFPRQDASVAGQTAAAETFADPAAPDEAAGISLEKTLPMDSVPGADPYETEKPDPQPAAPVKKGFPVFGIPALVMLLLMLGVFGVEVWLSMNRIRLPMMDGEFVGMANYSRLLASPDFYRALSNSLVFRAVQLFSAGLLACGLSSLYYAMKKPRAVLTFACLWLIPACLPFLSTGLLSMPLSVRTDRSGTLQYFLTTLLQTTSLFCFFSGVFTFLKVRKTGRAGGAPFYGLVIGALVFLLGALNTSAASIATRTGPSAGITLDMIGAEYLSRSADFGRASSAGVVKVVGQILLAIVPMIVLAILARRKSTRGRMSLNALWVALAIPFGVLLLLLGLGSIPATGGNQFTSSVMTTVVLVVIGGGFGGLIAYSFVHLLRRLPAFLFALAAMILAASLSCISSLYFTQRMLGLNNTVWPQVLLSAFDWRMVLVVTVLAFALRDYTEAKPGSLVIALALLCGALLWGEINIAYQTWFSRTMPVSVLAVNLVNNASSFAKMMTAAEAEAVNTYQLASWYSTLSRLLLAIPPLFLGGGAAWMFRRALADPKTPAKA